MIYLLVHTICCDQYFITTLKELFIGEIGNEHVAFEILHQGSKEECEMKKVEIISAVNEIDFTNVCQN